MEPVDWRGVLAAVFAAKDAQELKASKAKKKALKAAAQQSGDSADALEALLDAFLSKGKGGFELQGKRIVMVAAAAKPQQEGKKKKEKKAKRAAEDGEAAAPAEPAASSPAEAPAAKKRKRKHAPEEQQEQAQQAQQAQQQQGQQPRSAFDLLLAPPQDVQQPAAGSPAQQVQQQQASSRRNPRPSAAAAAAAAASAPSGELPDVSDVRWKAELKRTDVKSGPFSSGEKETIRQAVYEYAATKGLSTDDMSWLFSTSKSGETKGLWKQIAAKLPQRTVKSVWAAGTRMFHEGNYQGKWSSGEDSRLLELVEEKGRRWKEIGGALGRMPEACRDRWLAIRLGDQQRKGPWDEEEVERLRKAVEEYLAAKSAAEQGGGQGEALIALGADADGAAPTTSGASGGGASASGGGRRPPDRRVVLDDIDWNVVSRAVRTRSNLQCLEKWYDQLSPSMVDRGEWGPGDDRRLLRSMYRSGVSHDYELDWASLVQDRTAAQCRRRWRLMLKVLPDHRDMDFDQQVEELVDRYMPQLKGGPAPEQQAEQQEQEQQEQQQEQAAGKEKQPRRGKKGPAAQEGQEGEGQNGKKAKKKKKTNAD
ncbi:myb family transcription factor family [Chlorella sorokiniana]|uniref:Myb family transcription factor family n=1 Tax=Chlorella sorokiniana TaxID=3076 RepID=A0A2P6TX72_CHLSO|nr:myb family transcription factor family [Chlorella sorokiniana]|eukprot:PRW58651.1 myb family transcription factor family [Chlorella sorokiniana]